MQSEPTSRPFRDQGDKTQGAKVSRGRAYLCRLQLFGGFTMGGYGLPSPANGQSILTRSATLRSNFQIYTPVNQGQHAHTQAI